MEEDAAECRADAETTPDGASRDLRLPLEAGGLGARRRNGSMSKTDADVARRRAPIGVQIMTTRYFAPSGGLPAQTELTRDRAVFTEAYAVLPRRVLSDIVASKLPGWRETRAWILARPLTGFAETFAQLLLEIGAGGGADAPEPDPAAEGAYFVLEGAIDIAIGGETRRLTPGGLAYLPPGAEYSVTAIGAAPARLHWIRKAYEPVEGLDPPVFFTAQEQEIAPAPMPDTDGAWATTRFMDPEDMRWDMHVAIVTFAPGGVIPFAETHVMEHGLYILEGKGIYLLNRDWVEVEAGDFLWLRAFCPQACYAAGPGRFRYLLYKDVNRHPRLWRLDAPRL